MNNSQHLYHTSKKNLRFQDHPKPVRINESGHIHFVTTSCFDQKPFFSRSWTRQLVMKAINKIREKKGFLVLGYVLMPDHAHLLIAPDQCQNISKAVKHMKWYSSILLLSALRKKGMHEKALWLPGFYDFNVSTQKKFIEKLDYCHMNPVRRGLTESPDEWEYSSFLNYEYDDDHIFRVDRWWDYWKV